ncbi:reverse transcriptase family protein [Gemmata sp.]|uniref:reverse transcriptase family protein n=1 Tax=Gemmata sp. TaxID=1914242 RepID=UPI003F7076F5
MSTLPFDRQRFLYSLAGALRAAEWTVAGLRASFARSGAEHPIRVPGLFTRLLSRFPTQPDFAILTLFLHDDPGVARALARRERGPSIGKRKAVRPAMSPPLWLGPAAVPALATADQLAAWLGVEPGRLAWLADVTGRNRTHPHGPLRTYRHRWVPKASGRARLLEIPKLRLKNVQRALLEHVLNAIPPHPAVHGFCTGRSAVTNAAAHCGRAVVVKLDLADFFPSVPAARVYRVFRSVGYPEAVAGLLAGLCTTRTPADVWDARPNPALDGSEHATRLRLSDRHLPQGAPTSPALANLAAHRLDRRLAGLAARLGATYTRYADDLTFSGDHDLARRAKRLAHVAAVVAGEEGFALNFRKTRVMRRGRRQTVTGVVVNAHPNVPRADFDLLKATLTNCARHGPAGQNREGRPDFRAHLAGRVAHAAAVNPARGSKLWALFDRIAWPAAAPGG